jgi:hypothetical protein
MAVVDRLANGLLPAEALDDDEPARFQGPAQTLDMSRRGDRKRHVYEDDQGPPVRGRSRMQLRVHGWRRFAAFSALSRKYIEGLRLSGLPEEAARDRT